MYFIYDIWQIIFGLLDFRSKLNLISTSTYFRNNIFITDLYHIDDKYLKKLDDKILRYSIFKNVTMFNNINRINVHDMLWTRNGNGLSWSDMVKHNIDIKIKDISFLKNLKKLNAMVIVESVKKILKD